MKTTFGGIEDGNEKLKNLKPKLDYLFIITESKLPKFEFFTGRGYCY